MIIRYLDPAERLEFELRQLEEEGWPVDEDFAAFRTPFAENHNASREESLQILNDLYDKYARLREKTLLPDDLESIRSALPVKKAPFPVPESLNDDELFDRVLGGWTGRATGCLLGKPVEKYSRQIIREILESNHTWPLNHYFTAQNVPESILEKYPWKQRGGFESLRENIVCMPEDDDLNYTILNLYIIEKHGNEFTPEDVGEAWLQMLPVYETFTAERVAYFNLLNGISPPESGRYLNPFREWVGAQIRADLWGYVNPGDPEKAAEMAWRDGILSHAANGLYSEMFFAAVIAAAFVEKSPESLIETGLTMIPEKSRLSQAIRLSQTIVDTKRPWEGIVDDLYAELGSYHWVHAVNNAALTVAALLYSQGDYEKTICNAVMGGWDTDCNGATAGSVAGVMLGYSKLPEKWINPLKNRIRAGVKGFDNSTFTGLARRTVNVMKTNRTISSDEKIAYKDDF